MGERRWLRAGPLSLRFEGGDLRYVAFGERELVRRVYGAVRDSNWRTVPGQLQNLTLEAGERWFRIEYDSGHQHGEVDFAWHARITGSEHGAIAFEFDGVALRSFWKNRVGLCVLHPASLAGLDCAVLHPDGSREAARFPTSIAPHCPFRAVAALEHDAVPGLTLATHFEGDVFETEDQRNWTDASYKTYSTPLDLPFPALLEAGTRVKQRVAIELQGSPLELVGPAREPQPEIAIDWTELRPLPALGVCASSERDVPAERELELLDVLRLSHLRCDLGLSSALASSELELERAMAAANALGVGLELVLHLSAEAAVAAELENARALLATKQPKIASLFVFAPDEARLRPALEAARGVLAPALAGAPFGSGTNGNFTELNRKRPPTDLLDALAFSINPQEHASDETSILETFEAQREVVRTARTFAAGRRIHVTPLTLEPRFKSVASEADARQCSSFGAAFTLGSLSALSWSGAHSLTFYESVGAKGLLDHAGTFPLYDVLLAFADFRSGKQAAALVSRPLDCGVLALEHADRRRVLVASYRSSPSRVTLRGLDGIWRPLRQGAKLASFDGEHTLELELAAYEVVCLDGAVTPLRNG